MSWSKFIDTSMHRSATMDDDNTYHNSNHVNRLYKHANSLAIPYSANLDAAIMWHDVVYDKHPYKEAKSAIAFLDFYHSDSSYWGVDSKVVNELILNTTDHVIHSHIDETMILLDLYDLADVKTAESNYYKILEESKLLYGISEKEFAKNNILFMNNLANTVINNIAKSSKFKKEWAGILAGIYHTINISKVFL